MIIDAKVQDRYRKWLSGLGTDEALEATYVILGDSDVDYSLAPNLNNTRILGAPYSVEGIKHKLIYNGVGKNLQGAVKCFVRKVNADGTISSLYNYNNGGDESFLLGQTPPSVANGKNWDRITFTDAKMGYILYFQTILDYYLDENSEKKRVKESYTIAVSWDESNGGEQPTTYDYVLDSDNGSLLLAKESTVSTPVGLNYRGKVTVTGSFSNKSKTVEFNF
ncbi:MAG TPA: hypothetical protein VEC37_06955 [Bacillota bacterium]|nr:hypothetical protein [Bacillota bacterium]